MRDLLVVFRVVLVRPRLWRAAIRQLLLLAPAGWFRRPPFLPLPSAAWIRFRLTAQYGDPNHHPTEADIVTFLEWQQALSR